MPKGIRPKYNGKIQLAGDESNAQVGKISIWDNTEPSSEKSPLYTGTLEINIPEINGTRKYRVAIWKNTPKEE